MKHQQWAGERGVRDDRRKASVVADGVPQDPCSGPWAFHSLLCIRSLITLTSLLSPLSVQLAVAQDGFRGQLGKVRRVKDGQNVPRADLPSMWTNGSSYAKQ